MTDQVADTSAEPKAPDTTPLDIGATPPVGPAKPAVPEVPVDESAVLYEPTGDVGLDMALDFVGKAGISMEHPAMRAALTGDFTLLRATLAAKGAPGWEQYVALGEAAFTRSTKEAEAKAAVNREAVYKEAGGKDEWVAVQQWASDNATAEEKAELNALLNQGGLAAKGAVKYLVDAYARAGNVIAEPRDAAGNVARRPSPGGDSGPLSPKAYAEAVAVLNNKLNGRLEGSKEYAQLQARRQAHRG